MATGMMPNQNLKLTRVNPRLTRINRGLLLDSVHVGSTVVLTSLVGLISFVDMI